MVVKGPICKALRFLTKDELVQIHEATLEVLEHVGMRSDSDNILEIFQKAGADVDFENRRFFVIECKNCTSMNLLTPEISECHYLVLL